MQRAVSEAIRFGTQVSEQGKSVWLEVERTHALWTLRVIGHGGQISEWIAGFDSMPEAFHAGLTAIRMEGIDDYHEDPVFASLELADQLLTQQPTGFSPDRVSAKVFHKADSVSNTCSIFDSQCE